MPQYIWIEDLQAQLWYDQHQLNSVNPHQHSLRQMDTLLGIWATTVTLFVSSAALGFSLSLQLYMLILYPPLSFLSFLLLLASKKHLVSYLALPAETRSFLFVGPAHFTKQSGGAKLHMCFLSAPCITKTG